MNIRKYMTLVKYGISSGASAILDLLLFYVALYVLELLGLNAVWTSEWMIVISTVVARVFSSLFNYSVNRKVVFRSDSKNSFWKYYALCIVQMAASAALVAGLSYLLPTGKFGKTIIKLVVDTGLFFVSFGIQRIWVFKKNR